MSFLPCTTSSGFATTLRNSTARWRGAGSRPRSAKLIELDERRRTAIQKAEAAQARRNQASREIGAAKKSGEEMTAQTLMAEMAQLKADIPELEKQEKAAGKELDDALAWIPNLPLPAPEVPDGKDEHDNVEHHRFGAKREYGFTPKQHFELGEDLRQMDFETAAKLSGARFVVLKNGLARHGARARPVHARSAHDRARLHGSRAAVAGARRRDVWHGAVAEVCRGPICCNSRTKLE